MRISVVGLGIIGSVWARHWHADGHQVRTWNRTAKPDAPGFTADLAALAQGSELIAIVVADPPAVMGVLDRLLPTLAPGTIIANHATIGVADALAVAARVHAAGGRFIDMPFTGSKLAAEARKNVFFIGDDAGVLAHVEAAYRSVATDLLPIGRIGQAMALKLALNANLAMIAQANAEALALAEGAGIDAATFFAAIDKNIAKCGLTDLKKPKWLARDWSPQFSVKHMHKDLRLALALAAERGVPMPLAGNTQQSYVAASRAGLDDADFSAVSTTVRP